LYDPYNFDIYSANDYGGFTEPGPTGAYRTAQAKVLNNNLANLAEPWELTSLKNHPSSLPGPHSQFKHWSRLESMPYNPSLGADRRALSSPIPQTYQRWMPSGSDQFRHSPLAPHHQLTTGTSMMSAVDGPSYWSDVIPAKGLQNLRLSADFSMPLDTHQMSGWAANPYENKSLLDHNSNFRMETVDGSSRASLSVPNAVSIYRFLIKHTFTVKIVKNNLANCFCIFSTNRLSVQS
jgi:hypothetical protein